MVGNTASEERQSAKGGSKQNVKEQLVECGCVPGRQRRNVNVDSVGQEFGLNEESSLSDWVIDKTYAKL